MAVNFSEECQSVHSVVVVLPDEGATNPRDKPTPAVYLVGAPDLMMNEMCVNSETNLLYQTNLMTDNVDDFALCDLDDIEKGKASPKSSEECVGYLKSDDSVARALQKVIWLKLTGKFMQLFMNQNPDSPKVASKDITDQQRSYYKVWKYPPSSFQLVFSGPPDRVVPERIYDTITNRSRKYKRSQSFNSRRVVLLFSVMSSLGTIILILLTLKVKQISDGSGTL